MIIVRVVLFGLSAAWKTICLTERVKKNSFILQMDILVCHHCIQDTQIYVLFTTSVLKAERAPPPCRLVGWLGRRRRRQLPAPQPVRPQEECPPGGDHEGSAHALTQTLALAHTCMMQHISHTDAHLTHGRTSRTHTSTSHTQAHISCTHRRTHTVAHLTHRRTSNKQTHSSHT